MPTKHSLRAAALSVVCMGLGQFYNRQVAKGLLFLLLGVGSVTAFALYLLPGLQGLITLGTTPRGLMMVDGMYQAVDGDHSIYLLVEGLICLLVAFLLVAAYALNIRDARLNGKLRDQGKTTETFRSTLYHLNERHFPYMILFLPGVAILFLTILPLLFSILVAFTDFAAPNLPPAHLVNWNGLQTFGDLLTLRTWSRTFYGVFVWTCVWAVLSTLTTYAGGIFVAVLIEQKGVRFRKFWRTILVIPFAIPNLVSLLVFRNMFNGEFGPINQFLGYLGIEKIPWLTDPVWAKVTVLLVNAWLGIPVIMILVSGILTTIPRDLYESAEIDGASPFKSFRMITLPLVYFSTAPVLIMQFASNLNNFNVIYLLTDGNPVNPKYQYAGSTDLLVTWLYKLTLNNQQYNFSSAIGIIIFVIVAGLAIFNFRRSRSYKEEDMVQ